MMEEVLTDGQRPMSDQPVSDTAPQPDAPTAPTGSEEGATEGGTGVDVWDEDFDVDSVESDMDGQPAGSDAQGEEPAETESAKEESDRELLEKLYREQLEGEVEFDRPLVIKYKGKYLDIKSAKELKDLAEKGVMATQKASELAEYKRMLEGIDPDDIELIRRARAGDVDAANALLQKGPAPEPMPENYSQAERIAQEILGAPYAEEFREAVSLVPESQRQMFVENPALLGGLKADFENGTAQKLMPKVERYMAVQGMDFISAYRQAAMEVIGKAGERESKAKQLSSAPSVGQSVIGEPPPKDVWDMSKEEFESLMTRMR